MFPWEVGWGDIALGVLGVGCAWKKVRGQWMTAAMDLLLAHRRSDRGRLHPEVAAAPAAP